MDSLRDNTMRLSVGSETIVKTQNKVAGTSCKHCGKRYSYDPEKLGGRTFRYRCRQCGGTNLLPGVKTASRPKTAIDTGKTPGSGEIRDSIDSECVSRKPIAAGVSLWVVWLPSIVASATFGWLSAFAVLTFVAFYMHALYGRLRDSRPVPFREKFVERRPEPWQCIAVLGFASFAIFINQYDLNPIGHVLRSLSVGM